MHFQSLASMQPFIESLENGELPIYRGYFLNREERMVREFILQLKLGSVDRSYFESKFGVNIFEVFCEPLSAFIDKGWMMKTDNQLLLTRDGLLRVDRMLPSFYLPEHRKTRYS